MMVVIGKQTQKVFNACNIVYGFFIKKKKKKKIYIYIYIKKKIKEKKKRIVFKDAILTSL